ncbi:MAG: NUDIX hydrolase [Pseudomonadota bacterium]
MIWKPNVTVASVLERDGKFLLVEEQCIESKQQDASASSVIRYNQPAGHLEYGESLCQAVIRETLEESAYHFVPGYLIGIYSWRNAQTETSYLRFAFGGELSGHEATRELDQGIIAAHWLTLEQIEAVKTQHRSPLVLRCIEDYRAGKRYPLALLSDLHE